MKKIFLCIFCFLLLSNLAKSERVTLGFSGDTCKKFNESKKIDEKIFKEIFRGELMGFMTGFNIANAIKDRDSVKSLDYNSIDYAYSNIVEYCRKNEDQTVFLGIIEYINSQPKPQS